MYTQLALEEDRSNVAFDAGDVAYDAAPRVFEYPVLQAADRTAFAKETLAVYADMHPGIYKIAVLSWAAFMSIFWVTFWADAYATFMVAVCTVYAVMFFGVPYVMSRLTPKANIVDHGLLHFLRNRVDTIYGPVNSLEALVQVILVPAALSLGGVAMSFIIHAARTVH